MNATYTALSPTDLRFVVSRIPRDVRQLMEKWDLSLGGGFIRELISGGEVKDIDLFGSDKAKLRAALEELRHSREALKGDRCRIHQSDNADTLFTQGKMPVQVIHRWTYDAHAKVAESFDFTVCSAVLWLNSGNGAEWTSCIHMDFYRDLAAKRLVSTHPVRNEDAGGSMLRIIKFVKRGYNIQMPSLGGVIARLTMDARFDSSIMSDETGRTKVLTGLLREVDPLIAVDGIEPLGDTE
jgi:hypothetical protein